MPRAASTLCAALAAALALTAPGTVAAESVNLWKTFQRDVRSLLNQPQRQKDVQRRSKPVRYRSSAPKVSLTPRPRPDTELVAMGPFPEATVPDFAAPMIGEAGNAERLYAYRDSFLVLSSAEDAYLDVLADLAQLDNEREMPEILADIDKLQAGTAPRDANLAGLIDELKVSSLRADQRTALLFELVAARDAFVRADIGMTTARTALQPEQEVSPETLALIHDLLDLPPYECANMSDCGIQR